MQIKEKLSWILDDPGKAWTPEAAEQERAKNIAFVHSLGRKCDSVGWSELDLSDPECDELLEKIRAFCAENAWRARGWYSRSFCLTESQWYRLDGEPFKESELSESGEFLKTQQGQNYRVQGLKAYTLVGNKPRSLYGAPCVSEDFLTACAENGLDGLRYCWLRDVGKYRGTQYFTLAPEPRVPRMMCADNLSYKVKSAAELKASPVYPKILDLGGALLKLTELFTELHINAETCYLQEDMPDAFFAYGYHTTIGLHLNGKPFTISHDGGVLLRRDAAEKLIASGVLTRRQLRPVLIADRPIPGYELVQCSEKPFPDKAILAERLAAFRELIRRDRPERVITEQDALKRLRSAKRRRKEDFQSALPKQQREQLLGTSREALIPYYAICAGGYLSNEYRLLGCEESLSATETFSAEMGKEETKPFLIEGFVLALCPDGDHVLLSPSGEVLRISHEVPEIIGHWKNLAWFIAETVS